ncbi:MAG TPA: hypothetical protein VLA93_05865 [Pyrinomonadaceae bacterium]|nr:hypothetical protein [Pyrinomonadaceae bacterium]
MAKADDVLRYFAVDVAPDQTFSADNLPPGRYWVTTTPDYQQTHLATIYVYPTERSSEQGFALWLKQVIP